MKLINPVQVCNRCGNNWWKRIPGTPKRCPVCKSPYWNKKRIRKVVKKHEK
jgi:predicted Zn-ribbon and HTH transcriptional regulator